jgi:hypothetical protein
VHPAEAAGVAGLQHWNAVVPGLPEQNAFSAAATQSFSYPHALPPPLDDVELVDVVELVEPLELVDEVDVPPPLVDPLEADELVVVSSPLHAMIASVSAERRATRERGNGRTFMARR